MMKGILSMTAALCVLSASASAQTLLYLNFDDAATASGIANLTSYTVGATEFDNAAAFGVGPITYRYRNNAGDGPSIGAPPGGLLGTAQGGKALLVNSGAGQDEGLELEATNGLAPQSITIEAVWFTDIASGGTNTAGIQSIIGNEWPFGQRAQLFIRTVGADRMDWWTDRGDSNSERVNITTPGVVAASTWYHDALVFTYNSGTPASSQIEAFRNGSSVGTSVYDATGISGAIFATGNGGARKWSIGFGNQMDANLSDHRGLSGGIDAVAISVGALGPGSFVLPSGSINTAVPDWSMF